MQYINRSKSKEFKWVQAKNSLFKNSSDSRSQKLEFLGSSGDTFKAAACVKQACMSWTEKRGFQR
jgi:hypothetical protein